MKPKNFIKTSLLGGLAVIIPLSILIGVFSWLFSVVKAIAAPVTLFLMDKSGIQEILAFTITIFGVIGICFLTGVTVKTKWGGFFHRTIEKRLLKKIPFYTTIKEIVSQFFQNENTPFSKVALVSIFNNETLMTALITDETIVNGKTIYTVFVPTGPNPTSGNIYHLPEDQTIVVDIPSEIAMKSIIACGAGSNPLVDKSSR